RLVKSSCVSRLCIVISPYLISRKKKPSPCIPDTADASISPYQTPKKSTYPNASRPRQHRLTPRPRPPPVLDDQQFTLTNTRLRAPSPLPPRHVHVPVRWPVFPVVPVVPMLHPHGVRHG